MLIVHVDATPGQELSDAIRDACKLARRLSSWIELRHNDRRFILKPDSDLRAEVAAAIGRIWNEKNTPREGG